MSTPIQIPISGRSGGMRGPSVWQDDRTAERGVPAASIVQLQATSLVQPTTRVFATVMG